MYTTYSELHGSDKGQISPGLVIGIVVMLAVTAFGGLIFSQIQDTATAQVDDDNDLNYSIGENIVADVGETGADLFPLILLVVTLAVFGAIIAVLKMWA